MEKPKSAKELIDSGAARVVKNGDSITITRDNINRHTGDIEGEVSNTRTVQEIQASIENLRVQRTKEDALFAEKIRKLQDQTEVVKAIADFETVRQQSNAVFDRMISDEEYLLTL
jgi:ribonucleotide reductase alpha subunit